MRKAENHFFYVSESVPIKMERWHSGRVVLLGDARYCPSPNSGLGTPAPLVGCYVPAGELGRHQSDVNAALWGYESVPRPFVADPQKLLPVIPRLLFYDTRAVVWFMHRVVGALTGMRMNKLLFKILPEEPARWKILDYPELAQGD